MEKLHTLMLKYFYEYFLNEDKHTIFAIRLIPDTQETEDRSLITSD